MAERFDFSNHSPYNNCIKTSPKVIKMTKMDNLDREIVKILQDNARLTNADIAANLHVSEATVRRRIQKLLDANVFQIRAVADPFKLGYEIIVIIGVWVDKGCLRQAEEFVCALPEARFVGVTMGSYDIMLEAWFHSMEEMGRFITDTLATVPGISKSDSFQVIRLSKYTYDWGRPS
jgi:Lrp/AsnC family transcriptional regulator, regulator for asnA, asnC and gidA